MNAHVIGYNYVRRCIRRHHLVKAQHVCQEKVSFALGAFTFLGVELQGRYILRTMGALKWWYVFLHTVPFLICEPL